MGSPPHSPSGAFRVGITPDFYTDAKGRFEAVVEAKFKNTDVEWSPMPPQPDKIGTPAAMDQFDALFALGLRINAESLRGVDRLAVVARWGVGYDMIDVDALTAADVALAITPGAVRRPVAEAILTFAFALSTNLIEQDRVVREGGWRGNLSRLGRNIRGRVLGSVGFGNIAAEMFRMAQSLGFARLIASDPYADAGQARAAGVELVSMEELLAESDYLTVNCFLSAATKGLIGEPELRRMKPTAYLINTARGPIVDERALVKALEEGWIGGAGLDVFENEPLPQDSPVRRLRNAVLSPHGLAWTEELVRDNGMEACDNILAISRGDAPATIVNKEVIQRPRFQGKLKRYRDRR